MTPILQKLAENRLQTLHLDRRSIWGHGKSSASSLDTLATYESETEDETFSSSTSVSDVSEEDEDEQFCWWSVFLSRIKQASRLENVILHDEVLPRNVLFHHGSTSSDAQGQHPTRVFFDCLLRSLPSLPKLRQLRIYISRRSTLNYDLLHQVVQACPHLEQLILCGGSSWEEGPLTPAFALLSHHQILALASTIRNHPSLVEVSLQECFVASKLSIDPILLALSTLPRLEVINLTLTHSSVCRVRDASIKQLFRVKTLQDATLWSVGLDDAHMQALVPVLPVHPALVFLSLRCNPKITALGWQTLCDMVQDNHVLRSVYTDEIVSPKREAWLQHFLYWNQCGRGKLLQSHDPDLWQDCLMRWKDDPTAVFYLIQQGHACLLSEKR